MLQDACQGAAGVGFVATSSVGGGQRLMSGSCFPLRIILWRYDEIKSKAVPLHAMLALGGEDV
jgi:hypothetical protein